MVWTFTADLVMKAIKNCRNNKAFGTDRLSIFHLKHLGPKAIEYITTLFNNLSDSGHMEVIFNQPYTETRQGHLPRNFLPTNLVNLPSRKSHGISVFTNNQQISHPCSRPTRFQTWTFYHLGSAAVNNRRCSWIQPEEAPRSNSLRCCRFIGGIWYSLP